jgi:hypothetical protein
MPLLSTKTVGHFQLPVHENTVGFLVLELGDKDSDGRRGVTAKIIAPDQDGKLVAALETAELEPAGLGDVVGGLLPHLPSLLAKFARLVRKGPAGLFANATPVRPLPDVPAPPPFEDDDESLA